MPQNRVLQLSDIRDSSGLRPVYRSPDDSTWIPDGEFRVNDSDGYLRVIINYSAGVIHGSYTDFWSNGQVACAGQFENGRREGLWHYYNQDGTLSETIRFVKGKETIDWDSFFSGAQNESETDDANEGKEG